MKTGLAVAVCLLAFLVAYSMRGTSTPPAATTTTASSPLFAPVTCERYSSNVTLCKP
jgi:hypothetical protein